MRYLEDVVLKKWSAAVLAGALAVGALAGCGGDDAGSGDGGGGGGKLTMGFSQVGAESGWRTANTKSIQDSAATAGIDLKFSDAQG
jgi:ABC-type sugar transport system substrate-binding protein